MSRFTLPKTTLYKPGWKNVKLHHQLLVFLSFLFIFLSTLPASAGNGVVHGCFDLLQGCQILNTCSSQRREDSRYTCSMVLVWATA